MVQITVSDEIARQLDQASHPVVLVDSRGRKLGQVTRLADDGNIADDDWAEAKLQIEIYQREGGTFYTTDEVLEHIKSLGKE